MSPEQSLYRTYSLIDPFIPNKLAHNLFQYATYISSVVSAFQPTVHVDCNKCLINLFLCPECGGKMHLREGDYEKAHTDFFEVRTRNL